MKVLLLVAGSRAGGDFFHSLLDGHSQILEFPGHLNINKNFYQIFSLKNTKNIPDEFINQYPHFFDSRKNKVERHNQLGKIKNKHFIVDKEKFVKHFLKCLNKKKVTKFNILYSLHAGYTLAKGKKIKKKKLIFINTHIVDYTKNFISFMKINDIQIIYNMRNPLSALSSPIKNWLKYKEGSFFFCNSLFFHFDVVYKGLQDLLSTKKKLFVIQLEKLHIENDKVMRDFCKLFKITFESCLKKSTYHNLQWWGDEISGKYINGINKNFKINYEKNLFFKRDISFFEFLAEDLIKHYGYKFSSGFKKKYFFNILPMKCELIIWKNTLKNKKFIHIFSLPYFYLKRLIMINKFSIKKIEFPYSIGTN